MASMRYPNRLILKDSNGKREVRPRPGPCFQSEFCHLLVGDHAVEVTSLSVRVLPGLLGHPPWPLSAPLKNQEVMQMPHQASVGEGHHFSPGWGPAHRQSPFYPEESDKTGSPPGQGGGRHRTCITWRAGQAAGPDQVLATGLGQPTSEAPGTVVLILIALSRGRGRNSWGTGRQLWKEI